MVLVLILLLQINFSILILFFQKLIYNIEFENIYESVNVNCNVVNDNISNKKT